jgi:hypothetical protein
MTHSAVKSTDASTLAPEPTPAAIIQAAQSALGTLQYTYRDHDPKFWALAWYVVEGDAGTAADKLQLLKTAIADYERMMAAR